MRILVTGATGFLGSHIARELSARGHQVRILRRPHSPTTLLDDLEVEHAIGDLFEPATLDLACRGMEAVVHCAAEMSPGARPRHKLASHLEGTRNLLAAASHGGIRRFVYTSSVAALGMPDGPPAPTDAAARPMDENRSWRGDARRWPYGHVKHLAEQQVLRAGDDGMEPVILNPALVIGPGDRHRVSNLLVWHMLRGRMPPIMAGGLNVVDVRDVAEGTAAALTLGQPGRRYLLSGENRTLEDLIRTTAEIVGRRPPRLRVPIGAARLLGETGAVVGRLLGIALGLELLRAAGLYFYYDGSRSRQALELGEVRPYEPAARASADWYRRSPSGQTASL